MFVRMNAIPLGITSAWPWTWFAVECIPIQYFVLGLWSLLLTMTTIGRNWRTNNPWLRKFLVKQKKSLVNHG
jgi:hypothetical protein